MRRSRILIALAVIVASSYAHQAKAVPIAYTTNGEELIRFDIANPGGSSVVGLFSGAVNAIDGLDFRPANGLLYGYSSSLNSLVTINPLTAVTTFVSSPSTGSSISLLGVDFNPVPDRLRLVNLNDQNLRINVDTGQRSSMARWLMEREIPTSAWIPTSSKRPTRTAIPIRNGNDALLHR